LKRPLLRLTLAALGAAFLPAAVLAADPTGSHDLSNCDISAGWACDADDYSQALAVHFYADGEAGNGGTFLGAATADLSREAGVAAACGGYGSHGFSFTTPDIFKDGYPHTVYVYAINTGLGSGNPRLPASPKVIRCGAAAATQALPEIPTVEVTGGDQMVFDWTTNKCENNDIPDVPARAFRDSDGKVHLHDSHYVSYEMAGDSLNTVTRNCTQLMSSPENTAFTAYSYHDWLSAPYTLDGVHIYSLVHNEWYGSLANGCYQNTVQNCWVNSILMAESGDKGASFHLSSPYTVVTPPVAWQTDFASVQTIYGSFNPSNIVNFGDYYYSFFLSSNLPGKAQTGLNYGDCLLRTLNPTRADSWQMLTDTGWESTPGGVCKPLYNAGSIISSLGYNTYLQSFVASLSDGSTYFRYSFDLIHWTDPQLITSDVLYYASLLDPADPSMNFELPGREPFLYHTIMNGNLDRDLVRRRIKFTRPAFTYIKQSSPASPTAAQGTNFSLTYNWAGGPTASVMTALVHFVDSADNIVFQDDHQPASATNQWLGPDVSYTRTITVPAGTPAGTYKIVGGLYTGGATINLKRGSGVTDESQGAFYRYQIGTLTVNDTTTPAVSITSPSNGSSISGTVNVAATASDNVGVAGVGFYVDNIFKSTDTTTPYNYSFDATLYTNASHTILAKAYDAAGNYGTASVSVTVDAAAPAAPGGLRLN
jgi:hypothetical protein